MPDILQIIHDYLGENTDDDALKLMSDVKNALDENKQDTSEWESKIEAITKERDDAVAKEKELRKQYLDAFVNGTPNAKPVPTSTEEKYPDRNLSVDDWLFGNK